MVETHYVAGLLALVAGFVALFAPKGSHLHRRSGRLFVFAMAAMLGLGAYLAFFVVDEPGNGLGALLTIYLVLTSLLTVKRRVEDARGITAGLAGFALAIGILALAEGSYLVVPVALACGASDLRLLNRGSIAGTQRLVRHLWRMTFALFVATGSFFLGQAKVIPEPLRNFALLSIPVLTVLAMLLYWLWRMNGRRGHSIRALQGDTP